MHKLLKPESTLVQQGNVYATCAWIAGDIVYGIGDPLLGTIFLASNALGVFGGQNPLSTIIQHSLFIVAGGVMCYNGMNSTDEIVALGDNITGIGTFLATTNVVGSLVQEHYGDKNKRNLAQTITDPIVALPTKACQWLGKKYADANSKLAQEFSETIAEISERPMFPGSLMLGIVNCGILASGISKIIHGEYAEGMQDICAFATWNVGNFFCGVSTQAEARENIFMTWGKNAFSTCKDYILGPSNKPNNNSDKRECKP
jgi:hypothetical protein